MERGLLSDSLVRDALIRDVCITRSVAIFDRDGAVVDANEAYLAPLGYDQIDAGNLEHVHVLSPGEDRQRDFQALWNGLLEGTPQTGEYELRTKKGEIVWIAATYIPIKGDDGVCDRILKYGRFVTERKLLDADAFGQVAAINLSQAVVEFSMDGTILRANPLFLEAVGYQAKDVEGRHHSMLVDPAEAEGKAYADF